MPCTSQMIDNSAQCAASYSLNSFTATPATVTPGQAVTLRWNISRTGRCNGRIKLNGVNVPMVGSKVVNPLSDTTYRLQVSTPCNITRNLGQRLVDVNTAACQFISIPEPIVRSQIIQAVDASIAEHNQSSSNDLTKRSQTSVEIDNQGIVVRLRLEAAINNAPDPAINVDMRIGLGVGPGNTVSVFYISYSLNVDWPWWFHAITLGISAIVEHIVENRIEQKMKPQILTALRNQINSSAGQIPGVLASIQTIQDAVRVQVCN